MKYTTSSDAHGVKVSNSKGKEIFTLAPNVQVEMVTERTFKGVEQTKVKTPSGKIGYVESQNIKRVE